MLRPRFFPPIVFVLLVLSLGLALPSVHAATVHVKLCGFTQFADLLIVDATFVDESPLTITTTWTQFVPNTYILGGAGVTLRDPELETASPDRFIGTIPIFNRSDSFLSNRVGGVVLTLVADNALLPSYVGTAVVSLFAGPTAPFQVTLNTLLINCKATNFPSGEAMVNQVSIGNGLSAAVIGQSLMMKDLVGAAGDEQNNEYVPR